MCSIFTDCKAHLLPSPFAEGIFLPMSDTLLYFNTPWNPSLFLLRVFQILISLVSAWTLWLSNSISVSFLQLSWNKTARANLRSWSIMGSECVFLRSRCSFDWISTLSATRIQQHCGCITSSAIHREGVPTPFILSLVGCGADLWSSHSVNRRSAFVEWQNVL